MEPTELPGVPVTANPGPVFEKGTHAHLSEGSQDGSMGAQYGSMEPQDGSMGVQDGSEVLHKRLKRLQKTTQKEEQQVKGRLCKTPYFSNVFQQKSPPRTLGMGPILTT